MIRGPSYKNKIETKGVLLDATKRVDRGLADFTSLDHGTGKGLGGDDGEPVSVLYQNLHDTSIDGAEDLFLGGFVNKEKIGCQKDTKRGLTAWVMMARFME